ncbi:uracil-DNA glycosylase, DNA polymerase processivity factor [Mythimna separata entomopoxvirus 'L']|uniref:Uracil-DNA glycosylase n=1 Tax=Mythimna separata entomopoxvirus 'L' TaxID=1293572 RepID=A0A916P259_9POXV|nr:uracil-DNA glycosylase, DNA polymerase processivity factor [Mythimna separata entomopoxvirus 'L']CCU56455.1 uracil-DNA glycosylase, DNA polymerase processivity factor [Mythimna separata entomopoxvirus 'L']
MISISYEEFINLIPQKWFDIIDKNKLEYSYYKLKNETIIKPPIEKIFNSLKYFNPDEVKVIILGQDPYPGLKVADGLAFSCTEECKIIPVTLRNIITEILSENRMYDMVEKVNRNNFNTNLEYLAKQKILLLNTILTVGKEPMSHAHIWESITNNIIKKISTINKNLVFILFGVKAHKKINYINNIKDHFIIKTSHPSYFSCNRDGYDNYDPFNNSNCFTRCNEYLKNNNIEEIDWLSGLLKK